MPISSPPKSVTFLSKTDWFTKESCCFFFCRFWNVHNCIWYFRKCSYVNTQLKYASLTSCCIWWWQIVRWNTYLMKIFSLFLNIANHWRITSGIYQSLRNTDQNIGDSMMSVIFRIYIGRNVFQVVTGLALFTHWLTKFIHSSGWKYLQTGLKSTNLNAKDSIIQSLDIWIWATKQFINFKFALQIFLDVFDNTFK